MSNYEILKKLTQSAYIGGKGDALSVAEEILSHFAVVEKHGTSVCGLIEGSTDKTILFDAHIDQVGMSVTSILPNGFLKVAPMGSVDPKILSATAVKVMGKKEIDGVFCSVPPHLKTGKDKPPTFDSLVVDTGVSNINDFVSLGDKVVFSPKFEHLLGSTVSSPSLDDRAGVTALILAAEMIKKQGKPKFNCLFVFSDMEETGGAGAKTVAFDKTPDFAIAVDVSFGNTPFVSADKTAKLSSGVMIGNSPILDQSLMEKLKLLAKQQNIKYTEEIMSGRTSTNADHISVTKGGVKTALLSIPLRNMHTPVEVCDMADIEATAKLLAAFATEVE